MKKGIHPKYQPIIFHDVSCNKSFLISSTLEPKEKMVYEDGNEYPVFKVETSSESHPFYTGKGRMETKEGRIAQFRKRYTAEAKPEEKVKVSTEPKLEPKMEEKEVPVEAKSEKKPEPVIIEKAKAKAKAKPKAKVATKPKAKAKAKPKAKPKATKTKK